MFHGWFIFIQGNRNTSWSPGNILSTRAGIVTWHVPEFSHYKSPLIMICSRLPPRSLKISAEDKIRRGKPPNIVPFLEALSISLLFIVRSSSHSFWSVSSCHSPLISQPILCRKKCFAIFGRWFADANILHTIDIPRVIISKLAHRVYSRVIWCSTWQGHDGICQRSIK